MNPLSLTSSKEIMTCWDGAFKVAALKKKVSMVIVESKIYLIAWLYFYIENSMLGVKKAWSRHILTNPIMQTPNFYGY